MCQNVYFDVLDDIVDKDNNKKHVTIKIKPIDVKSTFYAEYNINSNVKNAKFEIIEFQNTKTFLLKDMLLIGLKKFL